jgi:ferrous iron transport protein B
VLDLPGAYSLAATSPDEVITRDVCLGRCTGEQRPDLLVCVVDATNLRLHLRFVLELQELGLPMVLALNMVDAAKRGIKIDRARLQSNSACADRSKPSRSNAAARSIMLAQNGALPSLPQPTDRRSDAHAKWSSCSPLACRCRTASPSSTPPRIACCCIRCSAWRS